MLKSLRNAFISGLLLLAPIGVTLWVINFLVLKIGKPTRELFFPHMREHLEGNPWFSGALSVTSALIVLLIITMIGWFSKLLIGRWMVQTFERILNNVPFVRNVYNTVKQIIDTFSQQKKAVFQKAVMVEFPRKGIYAMGFLTGDGKGEVQERTGKHICNIFLPTTPNPTSGYLIMVPEEDVTILDMTIPEGMKFIISGGAVVPVYNKKTGETELREVQNPEVTNAPVEAEAAVFPKNGD